MKKIVIALDYSPMAEKVAELGYAFAKAMNAQVILLHVVSDYTYYSSLDYSPIMGYDSFSSLSSIQLATIDGLKDEAKNFLDRTKEHLGDAAIQTEVSDGDFADAIMDTAKKLNADIIVLGTHSRSGIEKMLVGSVTEKILRHSTIPLFVIPSRES